MTAKKVGVIICISVAFFVGVFNIYRALIPTRDLITFEGKVINKALSYSSPGSITGRRYHLEFTLANRAVRIAISFTSRAAAFEDSTIDLIDTGKVYKFYLDPTFPTASGLNCGIRRIDYNNIQVFKKSNRPELYGGLFFILLSLTLTFVVIKFGKWKKGS